MNRMRLWLPIILWGGIILLASHFIKDVSGVTIRVSGSMMTKAVGHLAAYLLLGFFVARYISARLGTGAWGTLILSASVCVAFGLVDELSQISVLGRNPEVGDLAVDFVGGAIGTLFYLVSSWPVRGLDASTQRVDGCQRRLVTPLLLSAVVGLVLVPALAWEESPYGLVQSLISNITGTAVPVDRLEVVGTPSSPSTLETEAPGTRSNMAHTPSKVGSSDGFEAEVTLSGFTAALRISEQGTKPEKRNTLSKEGSGAVRLVSVTKAHKDRSLRIRRDYSNYLSVLKRELARLEMERSKLSQFGDGYFPKIVLTRQIAHLQGKISRIEQNPPRVKLCKSDEEFLNALRQQLAGLEIREIRMWAYSKNYRPKLLLRRKIDSLAKRIAQKERETDTAFAERSGETPESTQGNIKAIGGLKYAVAVDR